MGEIVEIQKAKNGLMDDYFMDHYIENNNMTQAYIYAKEQLGLDDYKKEYAKQYGMSLFKRLRAEISERLDEMEVEDASLSRNVLRTIASSEEVSPSTRVAAAKELARKRIDRPSIKKAKDIEEINKEIANLDKQLKELS